MKKYILHLRTQNLKNKVVVITGGNRGIGLALVKNFSSLGFTTILACRDPKEGLIAIADSLHKNITVMKLDLSNSNSINNFFEDLMQKFSRIDILINNAGVFLDKNSNFLTINEDILFETLNVNLLGAWRLCRLASQVMINQCYGRVVNISSGWGSLSDMNGSAVAYRLSKVGLNSLTRFMSSELTPFGDIKVNSICPGWVKTKMGGMDALVSPEEASDHIVKLATIGKDGPTGKFFRSGIEIPW